MEIVKHTDIIYNRDEIQKIKEVVDYLVKVSNCTRESAVISMCKNGLLIGTFKTQDICCILELPYKIVTHSINVAEYKVKKLTKAHHSLDFAEHLLSINGRNFEICSTNL